MYKGISSPQAVLRTSYDLFAEGCLTESDLESRLQQNAFFEYAAQNWGYHIQDTQQSVGDLALKLLMDDGKASASSQILFFDYYPQQRFCGMHLVAYFGLNDIMVRLLEEKDPDTKDSSGRTPLSYAVERENVRPVELLLDYNVDLNSECENGWTPFSRAIEGGNAAVVQILLAKGVKIDNRYKLVRTSNHV
jgi:ankyrin repeat protein